MLPTLQFTFLNHEDTLGTRILRKSFSALVFCRLPRRRFNQRQAAHKNGGDHTGVRDHAACHGIARA